MTALRLISDIPLLGTASWKRTLSRLLDGIRLGSAMIVDAHPLVATEILENCQKNAYGSDMSMAVQQLTEEILALAKGLPEGTPVAAKSLLHLGNRAAVDQALSRLAERTQLIRAGRGVYLLPVTSRFGTRAPSVEQAVEALASQRGGRPSSQVAPLRPTLWALRPKCRSGRSF